MQSLTKAQKDQTKIIVHQLLDAVSEDSELESPNELEVEAEQEMDVAEVV